MYNSDTTDGWVLEHWNGFDWLFHSEGHANYIDAEAARDLEIASGGDDDLSHWRILTSDSEDRS